MDSNENNWYILYVAVSITCNSLLIHEQNKKIADRVERENNMKLLKFYQLISRR
jgi:hypothetical protein